MHVLVEFGTDHSVDLARSECFLLEKEAWWPLASVLNAALKGRRAPDYTWTKEVVEISGGSSFEG